MLCLFQIFYDQESEALLSHNCSSHVQKVEAGAAKTHPIEWNSGKGYKSSKHITNLVHKINLKIVPENILEFVRLLPKYSLPHPRLVVNKKNQRTTKMATKILLAFRLF